MKSDQKAVIVVKMDTVTGEAWVYDSHAAEAADDNYLQENGITREHANQMLRIAGTQALVPAHWIAVPEIARGVEYRQPEEK